MTMARIMALAVYAAGFYQAAQSGGDDIHPDALSMPDLLAYLGTHRERASASVVAVSLLEEMRRDIDTRAYREAKRLLVSEVLS